MSDRVMIKLGDCVEWMKRLKPESIDAIVSDPPYELGFMGKSWDASGIAFNPETWRRVLRVLKPGGHLLAFGGTRTYHRIAVAIEDAGFEIRDSIDWIYGQGFPKSLDVSKAIDKMAGAERPVIGPATRHGGGDSKIMVGDYSPPKTGPGSPEATRFEGWGTALKPAHEPIVVARKPLVGTVAANVLAHGTGAINVDGCRVDLNGEANPSIARYGSVQQRGNHGWDHVNRGGRFDEATAASMAAGRWPPNVLLTHSPGCGSECAPGCPVAMMDAQSGDAAPKAARSGRRGGSNPAHMSRERGDNDHQESEGVWPADPGGGASRFFPTFTFDDHDLDLFLYCAKASTKDRGGKMNVHPTVKPIALMRWLVRLVTPPGGVVLDPFLGSGTTAVAAIREGFRVIGFEREEAYVKIAEERIGKTITDLDRSDHAA